MGSHGRGYLGMPTLIFMDNLAIIIKQVYIVVLSLTPIFDLLFSGC